LASVAEDLGLSLDTLYRWLRDAKAQPRFSPAEVVAEFAPARASFTVLVPVRSTAPLRGGDSA
jgi:transposase-like protein